MDFAYRKYGTSVIHGFVRFGDGAIIPFDGPDAILTVGYSINAAGTITGHYRDRDHYLAWLRAHTVSLLLPSGVGGDETLATRSYVAVSGRLRREP
jgi:hypothetical protein